MTNKSKKHQAPLIESQEGQLILGPEETANAFNDFFISGFQNYSTYHVSNDDMFKKLTDFIQRELTVDTKFEIPPMTLEFVQKQLASLNPSKATGLDGLSANVLKISSPTIAAPLTKIFNLSISSKIFPDNFKKAKITPCFKKGDKSDKSNYRPISVLSLLSKVIERHVASHLKTYLNTHTTV